MSYAEKARSVSLRAGAIVVMLCAGCSRLESDNAVQPVSVRSAGTPWFEDVTAELGIDFVHDVGTTGRYYLPEVMSTGIAIFDADSDGRMDLYFIQGNHALPEAIIAEAPVNRFYRQQSDGTFEDATADSGLDDGGYGMGVAVGDFDNSGAVDVYITNFGPDQLYRNQDGGSFANVTQAAGIDVPGWSCSAAFVDLNHSGFLDLFVTQYVQFDRSVRCHDNRGRIGVCSPEAFAPAADVLLRNNGDATFTDVSTAAGIASFEGAGLGVVCEDFNDDGWADIYVANDGYANNLWINQHDETFVDRAVIMGVAFNAHGQAEASMGVVAADLDNDLAIDLFMTHLTYQSNTFYRNRGDDTGWDDQSAESGLGPPSVLLTGFGVVALDTRLRGSLDIAVANGRVVHLDPVEGAETPPPWHEYAEPNLYHVNDEAGRFASIRDSVSMITDRVESSRGLAVGDLNNDGRPDLVLANVHGPPRIFRNIAPPLGRWLLVDAIDPRLNRHAIGARVIVRAGGRTQMRTIAPASSYLTSNDPRVHFGLGDVIAIEWIDVKWPDGLRERFTDVALDALVQLRRGEGVLP